jgi:alanine racemase
VECQAVETERAVKRSAGNNSTDAMKVTRRGFETAMALALAQRAESKPSSSDSNHPTDSSFDPWIEIHAENLRHNAREVSRRAGGRPILAVIKNNGYGLGVTNAARVFGPMPEISGCAVVKLDEAIRLSEAGFEKPILLMGPFDEKNLEDMAALHIVPMVYTPIGEVLDRIARRTQRPLPVHICVDTGLGREGVPYGEAAALIRNLATRKSVQIVGTMMTFAEDKEFDGEQLRRFKTLVDSIEAEGVRLGRKHAASSFGLFQHPDAFLDMVRPGMALYGVYSEAEFRGTGVMDLRPGIALRTRVIYFKQIRKNETAGYERVYRATRDTWLATLPVGHADGVPRSAVQGGRIRINGRLFPVAAVSASHIIIQIVDDTPVKIGDVATVFDWTEGSRPEDFGAASKASVYDLTMHLNPLLRRRLT